MLPAGILVAALFALLAFAPFASAASDPVASGTTTININKGLAKKLAEAQVSLFKITPASVNVKKRLVKLPVSGGSMDPLTGLGTLTHTGGIKFKQGKKTVAVKNLEINTSTNSLKGKIGSKTMKIASLAGFSFAREGFGVGVKANKLKLTSKAAKALNKALAPKGAKASEGVFKANQVLGSDTSATQPSTVVVVPSGNATLALSASALKKLGHVGTPPYPEGSSPVAVKLSPVAPTTIVSVGPPPTVAFPISGGTMGPTATAGLLQTSGGLKLVQNLEGLGAGVTTLTMGNIYVDMGTKQATVEVTVENPTPGSKANLGNLGRASIADISLAGATITSDPTTHTVSVQNASATLQAVTAATLNAVFIEGLEKAKPELFAGQEKFAAGDPLGTFSFTAQTQ